MMTQTARIESDVSPRCYQLNCILKSEVIGTILVATHNGVETAKFDWGDSTVETKIKAWLITLHTTPVDLIAQQVQILDQLTAQMLEQQRTINELTKRLSTVESVVVNQIDEIKLIRRFMEEWR